MFTFTSQVIVDRRTEGRKNHLKMKNWIREVFSIVTRSSLKCSSISGQNMYLTYERDKYF